MEAAPGRDRGPAPLDPSAPSANSQEACHVHRDEDPIDTHLLRVLCALTTEQSVSRTAIRLNQSQPAISAALKRLRAVFSDPLLVREKNRMVPTPRALELAQRAQAALTLIDGLLDQGAHFDPRRSEETFTLATPDYLAPPFLAAVVRTLRTAAPRAHLVAEALSPRLDPEQALADGVVDLVIGNWPTPPEGLHTLPLLEDDVICLMDRSHWLAAPGALTAERYLQAAHIVPTPYSASRRGVVESTLATMRVQRSRTVQCPYFSLAPTWLAGTDLILTTSRHFGRHHARDGTLAIVDAPLPFPTMRFYLLWHPSRHRSPRHAWFRQMIASTASVLQQAD